MSRSVVVIAPNQSYTRRVASSYEHAVFLAEEYIFNRRDYPRVKPRVKQDGMRYVWPDGTVLMISPESR